MTTLVLTLINEETNDIIENVEFPLNVNERIQYAGYTVAYITEAPEAISEIVNLNDIIETVDEAQTFFEVIEDSTEDEYGLAGLIEVYEYHVRHIDDIGSLLEALTGCIDFRYDATDEEELAAEYLAENYSLPDSVIDFIDMQAYGEYLFNEELDGYRNYNHFTESDGFLSVEHFGKISRILKDYKPLSAWSEFIDNNTDQVYVIVGKYNNVLYLLENQKDSDFIHNINCYQESIISGKLKDLAALYTFKDKHIIDFMLDHFPYMVDKEA